MATFSSLFSLAGGQTEGFVESIFALMGIECQLTINLAHVRVAIAGSYSLGCYGFNLFEFLWSQNNIGSN
ncbi:hypothetical protein [Okeania sp. SIO1I7]|uniref:hypothetical protein n=1 Tax=Okeania sp. SIO1I7 TaxID=2607772 RepID=UPI0025E17A59|nr:hypothetical protein [Okeania sp. SIO1I7]